MKKSWIHAVAMCAAVGFGSASVADEPAKFHSGLKSADGLIQDMDYLSSKLAKQPGVFGKNIKPNIEIFLIGVNPKLPVGMSFLFTEETGQRTLMQIPVEDLKNDFISGNLDPIGITAAKVRQDKTLYELSGGVSDGWMRAKGNNSYASISKVKTDVPEGLVTPDITLKALFDKGHDFGFYSLNSETEAKIRTAAFKKLEENRISGLKKKTDETQEAFDLRKLILKQQMENIGQIFSETQLIEGGWTTDEEKHLGLGQSHWTSLPNTDFAKWVTKLEGEKSHFASLSGSDKSIFTARVLMPVSEKNLTNLKSVYQHTPTVLKQKIEADKDLTPDEKVARAGAVDAGMEALIRSLDTGVIDIFLDIAPSEGTNHTFVLGMRSADNRAQIEALVGHLAKVRTGWSSQVGLETIGETKIHSFTVTNPPKAMLDFYGGDGTVYVAAGADFVAFSTGVGSLDVLKKLAEQATTGEKKALDAFVDVRFHAGKSLEVTNAFLKEKDFDLLQIMQNNGFQKLAAETKPDGQEAEKKPAGGKAAGKLSALKNFDWQQTAIDAMLNTDDLITIQMKLVNGAIDSEMKTSEGVLSGIGAVISKFAKENLGGAN
jgi:hypothetical protein